MIDVLSSWLTTSHNLLLSIREKIKWADTMSELDKKKKKEHVDKVDEAKKLLSHKMSYNVNNCINNDEEHNLKHFCKICKKGFGCGRALGGHMRAHGIGDGSGSMEDEDQASEWDDKMAGTSNAPSPMANGASRRMYELRTNPNRIKTCRSCENCGKEFSSWKSFLEHGKCGGAESDFEEERSPISSPESDCEDRRWSRRKSSLRANFENSNNPICPSSEEEDLAHCLMMLSNANAEYSHHHQAEPDHESCTSANRDDHFNNLMMGSIGRTTQISVGVKVKSVAKGLFECKACKKVFNSHQALGGHRASHKKVKGCFAARLDKNSQNPLHGEETLTNYKDYQFTVPATKETSYALELDTSTPSSSKRKSKVHECSICHRVFSSGQALGGHKRCHWITSNSLGQDATLLSSSSKFAHFDHFSTTKLDLNLPAFHEQVAPQRNALSFELSAENYFLQNNELKYNDQEVTITNNNNSNININNNCNNKNNVVNQEDEDDDANSQMKLAKLCELKDMNVGGEGSSSSWLQVGLGSTTTDNVVVVGEDNPG